MRIERFTDIAAFARAAGPLLDADPGRHTLAQTVLDRLRNAVGAPALLLTVTRRDEVVGAVLRERSRPAVVSALPPGCAAAVEADSAGADPELCGCSGPVAEAEAFAAARVARTGENVEIAMRMRLFRLVTLTPPVGVPGCARTAGPADVDRIAELQAAFAAEAIRALAPASDPRPGIVESIRLGAGHLLWEVDGCPVAYATARRPVAGMSRIGPVYTPPGHRGHGYGSAVTAAASAWAAQAGAREVVLFTDLSNPVSNAIYPRLGYRPVHDALELRFGV